MLVCVVVGVFPAQTIGPLLEHRRPRPCLAPATPAYSLAPVAWLHDAAADERRRARGRFGAVPGASRRTSRAATRARPAAADRRASRVRRRAGRVVVALGANAHRAGWAPSGCNRSCAGSCCSRSRRRCGPSTILGFELRCRRARPLDPALAIAWVIGGACAVAAAWQAKFHRLAALILAGGAGLVTCLTFVWFSAPDLALTQLLVEIVTTVLMLLGLRWLPKRLPRTMELELRARGASAARCATSRSPSPPEAALRRSPTRR